MMMTTKAIEITPAPNIMYPRFPLKESLFMMAVCSNTSVVVVGFKILFLACFRASGSEIPENKKSLEEKPS